MQALAVYTPDGAMGPRLATGWHWMDDRTLIGEVFDAEIVKLNWGVLSERGRPLR